MSVAVATKADVAGEVIEVIGAVVDVKFPLGSVPRVYTALVIPERDNLVLEVQQQLGDGVVRTTGTTWSVSRSPLRYVGPLCNQLTRCARSSGMRCPWHCPQIAISRSASSSCGSTSAAAVPPPE